MVTEIDVFSHVTESWLALPDDAWLQRAQELGLYVALWDLVDAASRLQANLDDAIQRWPMAAEQHRIKTDGLFQRDKKRLDAICKAWLTISKEWEQ